MMECEGFSPLSIQDDDVLYFEFKHSKTIKNKDNITNFLNI